MLKPSSRKRVTLVTTVALIAVMLGLFISQHSPIKQTIDRSQFHGTLLKKTRPINTFTLTGIDNAPFDNATLRGQWTMLFFGFTRCPSVCPTTMLELGKMYRALEQKGVTALPKVVMVSLDPSRDSPEQLKRYVKTFHPQFYGVRGDERIINDMAHEMGVAYAKLALKEDDDSAENYTIEHTGTIMLVNPEGHLHAFFTMPHRADLLTADYLLLTS